MSELSSYQVKDFTGGLTDNYLNRPANKYQKAINILIDADGLPNSRPGSVIYNDTYYQIPSGANRIGGLISHNHDEQLFIQSARNIYFIDGAYNTLQGPVDNNPALSVGTTADYISWANWRGHTVVTNNAGAKPVKIYRDENGDYQVRTAGLPYLEEVQNYVDATILSECITLANELRTDLIAHGNDSLIYEKSTTLITNGSSTVSVIDSTNINIGDYAWVVDSSGFADPTTVVSKTPTTVTLSNSFTNSTGVYTFRITRGPFEQYLHWNIDQDLPDLSAIPVASDLATLLTLTNEMKDVFTSHIRDLYNVKPNSFSFLISIRSHHLDFITWTTSDVNEDLKTDLVFSITSFNEDGRSAGGPYAALDGTEIIYGGQDGTRATLTPPDDATTLVEARNLLNNLKVIYEIHNKGWMIHGERLSTIDEQIYVRDRYGIAASDVSTTDTGVRINPNYEEVYEYANNLKSQFNYHLQDADQSHYYVDTANTIVAFDSSSTNSLVDLIIDMKLKFFRHFDYAGFPHFTNVAGTITNGSNVITGVTGTDFTGANILTNMYALLTSFFPSFTYITEVNIGLGTITMSANALISSGGSTSLRFSYNPVHRGESPNPNALDQFFSFPVDPTDMKALLKEVENLSKIFNNHVRDSVAHSTPDLYFEHKNEVPTISDILYAFHYEYTYNVDNLEFVDKGPITLRGEVISPLRSVYTKENPTLLSLIPVLSNGSTNCYDTANMKISIFRTVDGGSTLYKAGEITNGTTTFSDDVTDEDLQLNETLYSTGGILDNEEPPVCKYVHSVNNFTYYANITEGGEDIPERIRQSVAYDLDSCPSDLFVDLDSAVTGISSHKGRVIAFTNRGVFRLEGSFDELGRGFISFDKIYDRDGCTSHNSIVQIPEGIVFAGNDGFYYTDGYQVLKISDEFNRTYSTLVASSAQKAAMVGAFDPINHRVWWAVQSAAAFDCDKVFVLDLRWGVKADACFTTIENGTSFAPTYLLFYQGEMLRSDTRGYVFRHGSQYTSDPKIDTGSTPDTWPTKAIMYDLTSVSTDFGTSQTRKWVPMLTFVAKNEGDLSLQIASINDDYRQDTDLKTMRIRSVTGFIERQLRMPRNNLRCLHKQIRFSNGYVVITNSDENDTATVDATLKTVTIDSGNWIADPVDYYISFETDAYVQEYLITDRTATVLTVSDAGNNLVDGSQKWLIKGYPKDEKFKLVSYSIDFQVRSQTLTNYTGSSSETGSNA